MNHIDYEVLPGQGGNIGQIWLNRPRALNACDTNMCLSLKAQLERWATDDSIKAVIIRSRCEKAFCAGGDIRYVYDAVQAGQFNIGEDFFAAEYDLNLYIAQYSKPYIALLDGITFGGGVGISIYGSHRVLTERAVWGMPETAIGFFPDVGASYFLSRLPSEIGTYLALTATRIRAADTIYAGLGDIFISSLQQKSAVQALCDTPFTGDAHEVIRHTLKEFSTDPSASALEEHAPLIESIFRYDKIEDILQVLEAKKNAFTEDTLALLKSRSPTSLKVTLHALRLGKSMTLEACLQHDLELAKKMLRGPDFSAGVRAVVVDKDQQAKWQPAEISEVTEDYVKSFFAPRNPGFCDLASIAKVF